MIEKLEFINPANHNTPSVGCRENREKINELVDAINLLNREQSLKYKKRQELTQETIDKVFYLIEKEQLSDWAVGLEMGLSKSFISNLVIRSKFKTPLMVNPKTYDAVISWIEKHERTDREAKP